MERVIDPDPRDGTINIIDFAGLANEKVMPWYIILWITFIALPVTKGMEYNYYYNINSFIVWKDTDSFRL